MGHVRSFFLCLWLESRRERTRGERRRSCFLGIRFSVAKTFTFELFSKRGFNDECTSQAEFKKLVATPIKTTNLYQTWQPREDHAKKKWECFLWRPNTRNPSRMASGYDVDRPHHQDVRRLRGRRGINHSFLLLKVSKAKLVFTDRSSPSPPPPKSLKEETSYFGSF